VRTTKLGSENFYEERRKIGLAATLGSRECTCHNFRSSGGPYGVSIPQEQACSHYRFNDIETTSFTNNSKF
jgi:hypothetical protein